MKIYLGADHAGVRRKEAIKKWLDKKKIEYVDLGSHDEHAKDDYVRYAVPVAKKVAKEKNAQGILVCGSGTGMVIAANKTKGIRAAVAYDKYSAKMARHDNNANVLCLRARNFTAKDTKKILDTWFKEKFSGLNRHKRRVKELTAMEKQWKK